jgi:hypothetical protein
MGSLPVAGRPLFLGIAFIDFAMEKVLPKQMQKGSEIC